MSNLLPVLPRLFAEREFPFTEEDFQALRQLASELAGISLGEAKRELLYARLARRIRAHRLDSFAAYRALLAGDDGTEREAFVNAITTNHTSFFREAHHFELVRRQLVPAWLVGRGADPTVRLMAWSAGCSTGEEPYSLAMTLVDCLPPERFTVLATDLDSSVLATARAGIYAADRVASLAPAVKKACFLRGQGRRAGLVRVDPSLAARVVFRRHNMILEPPPPERPFDVIFCRNVVIYFDGPTQRLVVDRFRDALRPGGHLLVGHSENLLYRTDAFELVGPSSYRRRA